MVLAAVGAAVIVVAADIHVLLTASTKTVATVPAEIDATRAAVILEIRASREQISRDALREVAAWRRTTDGRLASLQATVQPESAAYLKVADQQLGAFNASVAALQADVHGALGPVAPLLTDTDKAVQDLHDSWDQNYDDVQGIVASSAVAITGVARAAEAVGKAAPSITASADSVANSAAKEAEQLTKPATFVGEIKSWALIAGRILGFLIL